MPNPNRLRNEISNLTKKVSKDILLLAKHYKNLNKDIESRFRDEVREQNGKIDGLEDFYQLNMLIKRNAQIVSRTHSMLMKLHNIENFQIDIEKDEIEDLVKELTEA